MAREHEGISQVTRTGDERIQGHIGEFSNGVFAFAITLLILGIVLPSDTTKANLGSALISIWPNYLAFVISFVVIGLFWSVYIRLLREIVRTDHRFVMLNLLYLFFVVVIPFSTSLISLYLSELSVIIYAALMACAGYMHTALRMYAGLNHRLISSRRSSQYIKRGILLSLTIPVWFTLSIGIALFSTLAAQISWGVMFICYSILTHRLRDRVFL
jgi:uncharacterized membrane protein